MPVVMEIITMQPVVVAVAERLQEMPMPGHLPRHMPGQQE
jgi:hypothetical protein